jgi:hypothetical protein
LIERNPPDEILPSSDLKALPSSLGDLHALKSLTLKNLLALEALPTSIARLTSLETLCIELCDKSQELLEIIVAMTNLQSSLYPKNKTKGTISRFRSHSQTKGQVHLNERAGSPQKVDTQKVDT